MFIRELGIYTQFTHLMLSTVLHIFVLHVSCDYLGGPKKPLHVCALPNQFSGNLHCSKTIVSTIHTICKGLPYLQYLEEILFGKEPRMVKQAYLTSLQPLQRFIEWPSLAVSSFWQLQQLLDIG